MIFIARRYPEARRLIRRLRSYDVDVKVCANALARTKPKAHGLAPCDLVGRRLIVTSARTLEVMPPYLIKGARADVVGARTATLARRHGLRVDHVARTAEDLCRQIGDTCLATPPRLYLRGARTAYDIVSALHERGIDVQEKVVYDMIPSKRLPSRLRAALRQGKLTCMLFFARQSAETFCHLVRDEVGASRLRTTYACALSERVAKPLRNLPLDGLYVAQTPSARSIETALFSKLAPGA